MNLIIFINLNIATRIMNYKEGDNINELHRKKNVAYFILHLFTE